MSKALSGPFQAVADPRGAPAAVEDGVDDDFFSFVSVVDGEGKSLGKGSLQAFVGDPVNSAIGQERLDVGVEAGKEIPANARFLHLIKS